MRSNIHQPANSSPSAVAVNTHPATVRSFVAILVMALVSVVIAEGRTQSVVINDLDANGVST